MIFYKLNHFGYTCVATCMSAGVLGCIVIRTVWYCKHAGICVWESGYIIVPWLWRVMVW